MSDTSKVFLSNGLTYTVLSSSEDIVKIMTHSDGKSKNHVHKFKLLNGKTVYLHSQHVVAVEEVDSQEEEVNDTERIKNNEEAAKKFKEDLDGNME